ncbi:hypothetical protein C8N38_104213 [Rhodovulum kholense]|uniref:Inner membrane protein n=1 Tax=Rhodovulum kholense TaxID=453584 RepID=A0A8E2VMS2_9RHOB|nr:hypothetical protein C8N38_104213 [Rhodovulum kholense]
MCEAVRDARSETKRIERRVPVAKTEDETDSQDTKPSHPEGGQEPGEGRLEAAIRTARDRDDVDEPGADTPEPAAAGPAEPVQDEAPVETTPEPEAPAARPAAAPAPAKARPGLIGAVSPVLGGILAAGIGFVTAQYIQPEGWSFPGTSAGLGEAGMAALTANADRLDRIETALNGLSTDGGSEALAGQIDALQTEIGKIAEQVAGIDARVTELANSPAAAASGEAAAALKAYEDQIAQMREQNAELSASVQQVAEKAQADIGAAMDRAAQVEARGALMRIDAALADGSPFAPALGQFGSIEVPEALTAVADTGVATLPELQSEFPAAARAALETSLKEQAAGGVGDRFKAFVRSQLGVRSLTPKEGDDADAILSRAEAALRKDDLGTVLSELDGLDAEAKAEMSDWIDAARARANAVEAAQSLEQTLNSN